MAGIHCHYLLSCIFRMALMIVVMEGRVWLSPLPERRTIGASKDGTIT